MPTAVSSGHRIAEKPRKADIEVKMLALGWVPHEQAVDGALTPLL